jgi:GTP-binding protein HflX
VDATNVAELVVFNKIDLVDHEARLALRGLEPGSFLVSARTGEGVEELLDEIASRLPKPDVKVRAVVPYDRGALVSKIHLNGKVLELDYRENGTFIEAFVKPDLAAELEPFLERT